MLGSSVPRRRSRAAEVAFSRQDSSAGTELDRIRYALAMDAEAFFDIAQLAATLPQASDTMLRDLRLVDRDAASCRIFRTYRPVPLHFHVSCDEYLYVLQGRAMFQLGDAAPREVGPGTLIHFPKRTVHGMPALLEEPFVVLATDTPRRPPEDVTFVDPNDGNAASFIATDAVSAAAYQASEIGQRLGRDGRQVDAE